VPGFSALPLEELGLASDLSLLDPFIPLVPDEPAAPAAFPVLPLLDELLVDPGGPLVSGPILPVAPLVPLLPLVDESGLEPFMRAGSELLPVAPLESVAPLVGGVLVLLPVPLLVPLLVPPVPPVP